MSVFLSFLSTTAPLPEPEQVQGSLPLDPAICPPQLEVFTGRNNRLMVWAWNRHDQPLVRLGDDAVHTLGYMPVGGDTPAERLRGILQGRRRDDSGSFSGVWHKPDSFMAYTSLSGSWSLFVRQAPDYTAVSNRLSMLTALGPVTLRDAFLVYMCGPGRSLDFGTAFEEVVTMKPGEVLRVRPEGATLTLPSHKHLFEPMDMPEALRALDETCETMGRCLQSFGDARFALSLSGGKDSRTLLAMLDEFGYMDKPGRVEARTASFCHDIESLSAQGLLRLYGVQTRHEFVARHEPDIHNIPARCIRAQCMRGASMNLVLVPQTMHRFPSMFVEPDLVTLGGLDCTLKFAPNTMPVETYIHHTRFTLMGERLIRPEAQRRYMRAYHKLLLDELGDKDRSYFQQLEGWWLPLSRAHSSLPWMLHPYFSPFLDTSFWKFFLSAPRELFSSHAAYYLIQRRAKRPLWQVPYADIAWPAHLPEFLRRHNLPTDGLDRQDVAPWRFDARMPGQVKFGVNEALWTRMELMQPYMRDRMRKHKERFAFVDPAGLEEFLTRPPREQDMDLLYMASGLLAGLLLAEYGADLITRASLPDVEADFTAAVFGPKGQVAVPAALENPAPPVAGLAEPALQDEKWREYDRALAGRMLFAHDLQQKLCYTRLAAYPDLLQDMGFAPLRDDAKQEQTFTVQPGERFRLEALVLGPCPGLGQQCGDMVRTARNPVVIIVPDRREAVFPDLLPMDGFFGTVVPLQDGVPTEWSVEFTVPDGVHRVACVFLAQEAALPVYVADVRGMMLLPQACIDR